MQLQHFLGRRRRWPSLTRSRQHIDLALEPFELEQHRARVERIERQRSTRLRRPERTVYWRRWVMTLSPISSIMSSAPSGASLARQPGEGAGDLDAALQPAADFEEAPAGKAVHVLVQKAREAGELAQQTVIARVASSPGFDRAGEVADGLAPGRAAQASRQARICRGSGLRCRRRCRSSRSARAEWPASASMPIRLEILSRSPRAAARSDPTLRLAAHDRRARCAPCLRSARRSGRARSGSRRRGWAGCRQAAVEALALARQQRFAARPACRSTTQTSAA